MKEPEGDQNKHRTSNSVPQKCAEEKTNRKFSEKKIHTENPPPLGQKRQHENDGRRERNNLEAEQINAY